MLLVIMMLIASVLDVVLLVSEKLIHRVHLKTKIVHGLELILTALYSALEVDMSRTEKAEDVHTHNTYCSICDAPMRMTSYRQDKNGAQYK